MKTIILGIYVLLSTITVSGYYASQEKVQQIMSLAHNQAPIS